MSHKMTETTMPAAEAAAAASSEDERGSYEFAFHILPTVAEGEVPAVFAALKDIITKAGGELFDEEVPERFDLAYDIVEHLEGKNRKFSSAYFGWIRFKAVSAKIEEITSEVETRTDILRYLLIRLTKVEEENPFRFHETLKDEKMVTTVDESKVVPDFTTVKESVPVQKEDDAQEEKKEDTKGDGEVDETELNEALKKEVE